MKSPKMNLHTTLANGEDASCIMTVPGDAQPMRASDVFLTKLKRQFTFVNQRLYYFLSFLLLDNQVCGRFRASLLRLFGATIGERCFIRGGLQIQEGFNFVIGDDVFVNAGCCFDVSAPIRIGNRVQFAYQVTLVTGGHEIGDHHNRAGEHAARPITIGDGAWIGARATILPGVRIGAGAVVAAGALVTSDVPEDGLVAGVPARFIRTLNVGSEDV